MAATNEARIVGVMAASGSGKGLWLKGELRRLRPPRLVVWDWKLEYQEFAPALHRATEPLRLAMMRAPKGALQLRYRPKVGTKPKQVKAEFEMVCRLVQAWGNCTFVAEELSAVTTPSWAPGAWRDMTTGGRHEGVHIYGVAQSPTLIDKTFLGNCTCIHVGPLRQHGHRQMVARDMDLAQGEIDALKQFEWIERDMNTGQVSRGRVAVPGLVRAKRATTSSSTASATDSLAPSRGAARAR